MTLQEPGDEIVIPDHMISQVHTSSDKRLSAASSSYTKKAKKNFVGPWRLGRTLGRGATGRVRLAKNIHSGKLAAVKIIQKATLGVGRDTTLNSNIEREIIIMKLISHPNIMALYDVWETKGELYLILEYVECGELFHYLVKKIRLEEKEAVHYFKQIISGVNYCHSFNICHRDLKPENILMDRHRNIKIADFGMAALEVTNKLLDTSCGSPHYASPEVVAGEQYHGAPSDIWSCGIILYALLTGSLPFDDGNLTKLLAKVRSGIFRIPGYVSKDARDLIKRMLTVNPSKRISIEEILAHPLLAKYPDTGYYYPHNRNKNPQKLPKDIMKMPIPQEELESEILKNLQILWHGERKSKIIEKLSSSEENTEKLFYYLLLKYRQEHAETKKPKSAKKKTVLSTQDETSAVELVKENKFQLSKSRSLVSTTIVDSQGNKHTEVSSELLNHAEKMRSTSYKKLVMSSRLSQDNLVTRSNSRRRRDLDGNLLISASSSRKNISFSASFRHSRRNIDEALSKFEDKDKGKQKLTSAEPEPESVSTTDLTAAPVATMVPPEFSQITTSLTSPKKKQRKSLTHSVSTELETRPNSTASRSKRSTMNSSTSKRNLKYNSAVALPKVPQLPQNDPFSGLTTTEFAVFCEQVFEFRKENRNSIDSNLDELEKEYQKRLQEKKKEEYLKEQERLEALKKAQDLALKMQEMTEKARKLEMENQRLVKERANLKNNDRFSDALERFSTGTFNFSAKSLEKDFTESFSRLRVAFPTDNASTKERQSESDNKDVKPLKKEDTSFTNETFNHIEQETDHDQNADLETVTSAKTTVEDKDGESAKTNEPASNVEQDEKESLDKDGTDNTKKEKRSSDIFEKNLVPQRDAPKAPKKPAVKAVVTKSNVTIKTKSDSLLVTSPAVMSPATTTTTTALGTVQATPELSEPGIIESKHSKTPSIITTTDSSIVTNPRGKQNWFFKVINNFVPSNAHEEEFRYESFLLVEDVQTLIRNALNLRLTEGSVSKVKYESSSITAVIPGKLANGRSLKVKILISPLKGLKKDEYKVVNFKKKTLVTVQKEKGFAKAFSKMGETIQLTIQNEENQFRTRQNRLNRS